MTYHDAKLQILKNRVERREYLVSRLEELKKKKKELEQRLKVLEIYVHNESIDVDNLENKTLTSVFYDVIGKKEEKLEKERAEMNEWILKRDTVKGELENINYEIERYEGELSLLENCEKEYIEALDSRLDLIKNSGAIDADHKLILEQKISFCNNKIQKINEACEIVEKTINISNEAIDELNSAENWGEADMFGRGKLADIKKYDHIGNADILLCNLKKEISQLKLKIADINIIVDINVELSEFFDTADWIFDNIFTASDFLDNVDLSKRNIRNAIEQIKNIKVTLEKLRDKTISELAKLQSEYDALK